MDGEQTPSPYRPTQQQLYATINRSIHSARRSLAQRRLNFGQSTIARSPSPHPIPNATDGIARHIFFGTPSPHKMPEMTPAIDRPRFQEHSVTPARISAACKNKFTHYSQVENPFAKSYLRKLMDICATTADRCENPRDILVHLQQKFNKNHKSHSIIVETGDESPFNQLYNYWASYDQESDRKSVLQGLMFNDISFPRFTVRFRELGDVGAGVTRNYFQMVVDDMVYKQGIFIPLDGTHTTKATRYTINEERMDPSLYKFVGELMAFCLLNEIPIPIRFSRSLLARMIYKENEIDDDMDVMYMITDYPVTSQTILNELMFSEYLELDGLDGLNPQQRFEKVKAYIRDKARRASVTASTKIVTDAFFLRNDARRHNWTIDRLDQLLSGNTITKDTVKELTRYLSSLPAVDSRIVAIFVKMLEKADTDFIEKLMQYWSGMKKIDLMIQPPYQIITINQGLPMASTCFNQLKLPLDVANEDELMTRFKKSIEMTGTSFGLD